MDIQEVYEYQKERFRVCPLRKGDEVYISRSAYRVKPMKYIYNTPLMCVKLIKRDKWWKFWEPKYKGAIYRMMEDY